MREGADEYMSAMEEFDAAGGNGAEKRIAGVLDGLGFARSQWDVVGHTGPRNAKPHVFINTSL